MIEYTVERVRNALPEMRPMLVRHYSEAGAAPNKIELDPAYDKYLNLDDMGAVHLVVVRDLEANGKMVGYCLSFLVPHMHHRAVLMSFSDLIYIDPSHRSLGVATGMFSFAEDSLRELGVKKINMTAKSTHDFGPMLKRLGYKELEKTYDKVLT